MKKKYIIINVFLSLTVLFSILFQSVHSYEHHSEQLLKKECHHNHSKNKAEITHSHNIAEKCMVCDFKFSSFTSADFYVFQLLKNNFVVNSPLLYFQKHCSFFKGSLFSLRAPPTV